MVQAFTAFLALCGLAYYCAAGLAARKYLRERRKQIAAQDAATFAPAVSLLKPLRGVDAGMYAALASHCAQDYPGEYELIFGAGPDDSAARQAVEQLQREFPERKISFIACPELLGPNGKVSTLAQMLPHARHDFLLINDSDIFATPDYLRRVMQEFAPAQVGMVTALYGGHCVVDARGRIPLWSKLEALTVSTEFVPGCLLAMRIDGQVKFALGGTLAIRREVLAKIGGFEALVDVLADDYEMGIRTIAAGYSVAMAPVTVQTAVPPYTLKKFTAHQLRWLRTVRDSRGLGYAGLPRTFGLVWAFAAMVASAGALWSWPLLSLMLLARLALALSVGVGVLGDTQVLRDWWLIPLRDVMGAWLWAWSYASDEVEWRGIKFKLHDGKLTRL